MVLDEAILFSLRPALGALLLTSFSLSFPLAQAQEAIRPPKSDVQKNLLRQRMDWFYQQRAYPHQQIPAGAHRRGWLEFQKKLAEEQAASGRGGVNDAVGAWQLLGPAILNGFWGVTSGRVSALAVDPTNANIVYLGAAQGGVWKTTDGGSTWTPLTDTQASLATGSIAIDPQNHLTIYVGTGEENNSIDAYYGEGILKSTDGGATWTNIPGPFAGGSGGGARIGGMAVQPNNSNVVLAAAGCCLPTGSSGVYRSADGGATWIQKLNVNGASAYSVIFDTATPSTVYAALDGKGVYRSTDAGLTWSAANGSGSNTLPGSGRVALAMDPNTPTTLWAAVADSSTSNLLGLYKTTDGGNNWTNIPSTPDFCAGQCWYDIAVAVQPGNSNVVVLGGSEYNGQVVVSKDGGATWTSYNNLHPDTHVLVFSADGSKFYTGDDGGIWSTTNLTAVSPTWNSLNAGISTLQFYPGISIDLVDINTMLAGTQDNTTELYSGTTTWKDVDCGDGGATAIGSTTVPPTMYTNCIGISLDKSTDGGNSWSSMLNGINTSDRSAWTPPLTMDPSNPLRLYFGTQYVYQTTNGAALWTAISPDLTNGGNLSGIAISPVDPNTVWAISGDGRVSVTSNALLGATATWTNVTGSGMLPNRYPTAVAADPSNASVAYVTFSGFSGFGDSLGHVFQTQNGGSTWTDVSGNLPNIPANDIAIDPSQSNTYFVGTDFGVFYTTNGGTAWTTLATGLPRVAVTSLKLHAATQNLRAATHGRSVWGTNVASITGIPAVTSLSPSSVLVGSAAFSLTVNGGGFTNMAVVQWNGVNLTTTFVSATQLTAAVPAGDLTNAGTANVGVIIPGGNISNTVVFTIDNPVPTATSLSPASTTVGGSGFTLTVTGTNFVNGATVLWNGSSRTTTFVSATTLTAAITAADINHTGTALVSVSNPGPGGGTSGTVSFSIVNPVPVATSLSPVSQTAGGAKFTLTVNGHGFVSGASVLWNGASLTTTFVTAAQLTTSVPALDIASPGTATVKVSNPGPGGGLSGGLTFTISNPLPVVTRTTPTTQTAGGAAFTLTVSGTSFEPNSVVLWNGSSRTTTFVSATSLTAAITAADIATPGTANVSVSTPVPGGGTSGTIAFIISNPKPTVTTLSPSGAIAGSGAFTLTANGANFVPGAIVQWNSLNRATTFVSSTQLTAAITGADVAAAGTAKVAVVNPAPGGGTSASLDFTIGNPVPVAGALSPSSALLNGPAFTLTVTGSSFVNTSTVRWGNTALTTTFVNTGKLTASVPASDLTKAGTDNVTVMNPGSGGGTSSALTFTVNNPAATLTSISPASVAAGSASFTLTATGTNFVSGATMNWNGTSLNTTFVSAASLTATIPASDVKTPGTATVNVSNPSPGGGTTASKNFSIVNPVPSVTRLSPTNQTAGGAAFTLTVTGTNFEPNSVVLWNGSSRTTTYVSAISLTAAITAADIATPGTANVSVTTPAPGGGTSGTIAFTIDNSKPTVTTLSPSSAIAGSGAFTLTVTGASFVPGAIVQWNSLNRVTTFVSATQLTAAITAADVAAAGTVKVAVANPAPGGGTSTNLNFTINNPIPVAGGLSPSSALLNGAAFTLTVTGSSFVNGSTVHWGNTALTTTFVNSGKLTASVPASDLTKAGTDNVTVVNPAPGGGTSGVLTFTVNNPAPTLTSISPNSAVAGSASLTLTATGSNFVSGATIDWNGSALVTTFVSAASLTATIPAPDLKSPGPATVTVSNPAPGGGVSAAKTFTLTNPVPAISTLSPTNANHGGAAFTLTVNGTGFETDSTVLWNGSARTTTYVSGTELQAALAAADIATAGSANVTVTTPAPGGGTSAAAAFTIR